MSNHLHKHELTQRDYDHVMSLLSEFCLLYDLNDTNDPKTPPATHECSTQCKNWFDMHYDLLREICTGSIGDPLQYARCHKILSSFATIFVDSQYKSEYNKICSLLLRNRTQ